MYLETISFTFCVRTKGRDKTLIFIYLFIYFNDFFRFLIFQLDKPFMPVDLALGPLPTVQAQIRRRNTRCWSESTLFATGIFILRSFG